MFKIKEGLQLFNKQTTVRYPSGNYGSFEIDGGAKGSWEGYSIGGRAAFMHDNGTAMGLYNDVNNEWALLAYFNGETRLYYNGAQKIATKSGGVTVNGTLTADSLVGSINYNQISNPPSIPDGDLYVRKSGDTMSGTLALNGNKIHLKSAGDANHYLKIISSGYSGATIDGPQLQGHQGGELTTNNGGNKWALRWNTSQDVYIGRYAYVNNGSRVFADNYHPNADKWTTARTNTVTLTGDASGSGSASVDGTGNWTVSVPVVVNNDSHTHDGRYVNVTGDTMSGYLKFSDIHEGIRGEYNASRLQHVYGMGHQWSLSSGGTGSNNFYGIAWSHPNAGSIGGANNLASHGMIILENGAFKGSWGGGRLVTPNDIRGTLFYDYNNTAYYADPASTSNFSVLNANTLNITTLNTTNLNVSGNTTLGNGNGDTTRVNDMLYVQATDSGDAHFHFGENSSSGYGAYWHWDSGYRMTLNSRNAGTNTPVYYFDTNSTSYLHMSRAIHMHNQDVNYVSQLHFNDNVRFYDDGNDNYLNFKWGDAGAGGIKFYDGNTTLQGFVYGDGSGRFGLLDNDSQWAVRIQTGTDPLELRCNNNPEFYVYDSYTYSPGSSRAPIFYDSNDTSYYADPTSTSKFAHLETYKNVPVDVYRDTRGSGTVLYDITAGLEHDAQVVEKNGSGTVGSKDAVMPTGCPAAGGKGISTTGGFNLYSDYIEVEPGEVLMGEIWARKDTSNTVRFYYGIERFDKNKKPIAGNTGCTYFVAANSSLSSSWKKFTGYHTVPTSHTSYGGSDGSGVKYVRVRFLGNYQTSGQAYYAGLKLVRANKNQRLLNDVHTPRTYDINNTGYYSDPASTSVFNDFRCDIMYDKDNTAYYVRPGSTSILNDARANIFYDRNNTAYYVHADSTSRLNAVDMNSGTLRGSLVVPSDKRGYGMFGTYSSYKTQSIWSMGTAYRSHDAGSNFGNLYGLAYKHTNNGTGGTMAGGHMMVWCQNGTPYAAMGSNIWTSGNVTAYSDRRVKTNLELIPNALEKVQKLNGYTFDRTDVKHNELGEVIGAIRQTGVVAQEVLEVLPEAVTGSEEEHYSVAYGNMVGLLIEAIKEQQTQIEELSSQLNSLKEK